MKAKASLVRIATAGAAALSVVLLGSPPAVAHGTSYPFEHYARARCYTTRITGTWTVMSNVYMRRTEGFDRTDRISADGSWTTVADYTPQWLTYRVWVGTLNAAGGWDWTRGNKIGAYNALGDGTDGLLNPTWFQYPDGTWAETGWDVLGATQRPWDVSLANGTLYGGIAFGTGTHYVYGEMRWGSIWNTVTGAKAFDGYTHWEPIGRIDCY